MRKSGIALAVAALVLLVFAQLAGASEPPIDAGPPVTFTDPTGDSGTALDITSVVVSNDAGGRIAFQINIPAAPDIPSDADLYLVMNTDNNTNTGSPNTFGSDCYFAIFGEDQTYGFFRWNGSDWEDVPTGTEVVTWSSGARISFDRSQVGNPAELTFYAKTVQGSGASEDGRVDFAPDFSTWTYVIPVQIPTAPSAPKISSKHVLVTSSGAARAGKPFQVHVLLQAVVAGQAYIQGPDQLSCVAKVAGKPVRTTVKPTSIAWTCGLVVPKTARGKTLTIGLKGKVTVSADAGDVSTVFAKSLKVTIR